MAVDKSYGSGKSRSAANSAARRRVAAGNFTKGKKGNATLRKIAKDNPVTGFVGGGVALGTLSKVAAGLSKAGRVSQSLSVADRAYAKATGRELGKSIAIARKEPIGAYNRSTSNQGIENLQDFRILSRDIFPKRPGPGKQPGSTLRRGIRKDILSSGGTIKSVAKGRVNPEGYASLQKLKSPGSPGQKISQEISRAKTKEKRVRELELRLNFPGKAPKRGR